MALGQLSNEMITFLVYVQSITMMSNKSVEEKEIT
jgi:hypothetical protein